MHSARQMKILRPNASWRLRFRALALLLFSSCILCAPASTQIQTSVGAQPVPAADAKLIEVKASGSKRFTQQEIAAASGLMVGTIVGDETFRKAARQLGETGAFDAISFTFSYSAAGTKLAFKVTDAEKFVPAHFADFVWFSDKDLLQKLHERAPLFDGELPTTGRLPDQVSDILQAMLVENGIPGHVDYLREPGKDGQLAAIDYSVSNVTIRIRNIEFRGAGKDELELLEDASKRLSGRDYSRALLASFTQHVVLPVYHDRGYLKAACSAPQPKVIKAVVPTEGDQETITTVDVALEIMPGTQYKLKGWTWSGNKNIPTIDLQGLLHAKTGKPANTVQLEDDLRAVQELYGSRGYVTATIKADAQYDDQADTVDYLLLVTEGSVFHMGELEFRGIDNALTARLREAWKIRPGDVYDATYLKGFLVQARKLLPASMDWEVAPHVTAMARDKTVDVDLQYTAKAPQ
ncbi:MAG: POTRA domain-containing protein [Candidatus Sulfotelmatobacter sp.]